MSVASFSCNPGYTKSSTVTRTCMPDENWSNVTPNCIINGKVSHFELLTIQIRINLNQDGIIETVFVKYYSL